MPQPLKYKATGETITVQFDFASIVTDADVLSAPSVSAVVLTGVDASPSSILSGSAAVSGYNVTQKITAGTAGVVYSLDCTVTGTSGNLYQLNRILAILPDTSAFVPDTGIALTGDLADGFVGDSGTYQYTASGGQPPYTYSWTGDTPPGAVISTTGLVTYTYTTAGPNTWQVYAEDSVGHQIGIVDSNVIYQYNMIATTNNGKFLKSTNFVDWTITDSSTSYNWSALAADDIGYLVAINSTGEHYATSTDFGSSWVIGNTGISPILYSGRGQGLIWDATHSVFILVGNLNVSSPRTGKIFTSPTGVVWTDVSPAGGKDFTDIASSGTLLVVVGSNGTYTSTDAVTFTKVNSVGSFYSCSYIDGSFFAGKPYGSYDAIYESLNGVVWTLRVSGISTSGYILLGNATKQFIIGPALYYEIMGSTDRYTSATNLFNTASPTLSPTNGIYNGALLAFGSITTRVVYSLDNGDTIASTTLPVPGDSIQTLRLITGV